MKVADLFCGCGGLSLGAKTAGFDVTVSVDVDPVLTSSYRRNFPASNLLLTDISDLSGGDLISRAGGHIDGIVGGPPCQGFSEIGLASPDDPRRLLLGHFFRLVAEIRPLFFLMENVRGLAFEKNRKELESAISMVANRYDILGPLKFDASDFGAATTRPRVFVIGIDSSYVDRLCIEDVNNVRRMPTTVRDAIADLGDAIDAGIDADGFDWWRYAESAPTSLYSRRLRGTRRLVTGHRRVPHAPPVAARFDAVRQGGKDAVGRHVRLAWDGQCPTIRAGTGPDRGSFQSVRPLHPSEPRVITVREAARLQGFPDRFIFHPTAWHSFRMIGNSVSPVAVERILKAIRGRLTDAPLPMAAE